MGREEWKETGKSLGNAFSSLGKNIGRSVGGGANKAIAWAEDDETKERRDSVFHDGSWRQTGKDLGGAFKSVGKNIIGSAAEGTGKLTEKFEDDNKEEK